MASQAANDTDRSRSIGIASTDDDLNRGIIKLLREDGRRPYKEIAKVLDVSEGTIRNRVQSMKQNNVLRIVAIADPMTIRYKADAIIGIKVAPDCSVKVVAERLARSPDIVYILWVSGRYDLLIEIVTNDQDRFLDFLDKDIHSQPDIATSETMSGLKNFKNQFLLKYD